MRAFSTFIRLLLLFAAQLGLAQNRSSTEVETSQSDATLRASAAASADRLWMVGDRGTILSSKDGGRTWILQSSHVESQLTGVAFASERLGWAVGGDLASHSHRSRGLLLRTQDSGQTWEAMKENELPRLNGVQSFGSQQLIAWGDWSPVFQSGLIESLDGGLTWASKAVPATHLRAAAWRDPNTGLVIDRLGRVFYFQANQPVQQLAIGGNPSQPLYAAAVNDDGWWLVGTQGQIYFSQDGIAWKPHFLPGTKSDHALIDLHCIAVHENHCWVSGFPANVIWHSSDHGLTWETQPIRSNLTWHTLLAFHREAVVVGGTAGQLQMTRNHGAAWWPVHGHAHRLSVLNFAATVPDVAFDALTYAAIESRLHCGVCVLHPQRIHEAADIFPDYQSRLIEVAHRLEQSHLEFGHTYAVGDLAHGRRPSDLSGYQDVALDQRSSICQWLTIRLRMFRPDILIVDAPSGDPLEDSLYEAVQRARQLASQSNVQCFSPTAKIPENPWTCQRMLAKRRLEKTDPQAPSQLKKDLSYHPSTVMKSSGQLLGSLLTPVPWILERTWEFPSDSVSDWPLYHDYQVVLGRKYGLTRDNLVQDLTMGGDSIRTTKASRKANFQTLIATSQQTLLFEKMLDFPGTQGLQDARWRTALQHWTQATPLEIQAESLWALSQGYRQQGKTERWQACLEQIVGNHSATGTADLAAIQWYQDSASLEIRHWRNRLARQKSSYVENSGSSRSNRTQASPFVDGVALASHSQIAKTDDGESAKELGRVRERCLRLLPRLAWDPRWQAIDAAGKNLSSINSNSEAEIKNETFGRHFDPLPSSAAEMWKVTSADERPRLDGQLQDRCWESASPRYLRSPWAEENNRLTKIRLLFDEEYLYLSAHCPWLETSQQATSDGIDELTLRLDTDGDFLTWFEFTVNRHGEVSDRLGDFVSWEPIGYAKTVEDENEWRLELAIPLDELTSSEDASHVAWRVAVERNVEGVTNQSNRPWFSDRLIPSSSEAIRFEKR
jgi:photosystem II stability/assembly factor-like uncharacterized protein